MVYARSNDGTKKHRGANTANRIQRANRRAFGAKRPWGEMYSGRNVPLLHVIIKIDEAYRGHCNVAHGCVP